MQQPRPGGPIFVVGTPRSGTTLTAQILGSHASLFAGGELHFFSDILECRAELGHPSDASCRRTIIDRIADIYKRHNEPDDQVILDLLFSSPSFLSRMNRATTYRDLYATLMDSRAEYAGKYRWINHVPKDIYHTNDIFSFFPNAKLVVCVRDVRDFLVSYRNRALVTAPQYRGRLTQLYHPVVTALLWKSTVRLIQCLKCTLPQERFFLLRYEDLVNNPSFWVRHLCEYLQAPYSESLLNVDSHNSSAAFQGGGIFRSSIGRWRTELSPEAAFLAQRLCGDEMRFLGYPCNTVSIRWRAVGKLLATTPWAAIRAVRASGSDRGGVLRYLVKRLSPYWQKRSQS